MHETIALLATHARMVWRFRWLALTVATLVCLIGWAVVITMPDKYETSTKVYLDTSSMLRPLLRGLAIDSRVERDNALMMRRTLLVRPNLETVARKTDLDLKAKTPEAFEALLEGLASSIKVSGTSRDNIFVISYQNTDPRVASSVVEAILNLFVERSLGESRKDTGKTKQFLEKQIAEYEARLTAAEARLKEFKQQNVGMMPEDGSTYFSRLESIQSQLSEARLRLEEAVRRRNEFRRQLDGVGPLFEAEIIAPGSGSTASHRLDPRISALEAQLDQLRLNYTERHPDVVSTRDMIEQLKSQRSEELAVAPAPASAAGDGLQAENAVYQELSLALSTAEAEVSALSARVEEYQRRESALRELVDTVPRIEAELARLNRDYDVNKRNYQELVKRRESLKLAEQASQTTDNVKFNVLEPPRVPLNPIGPDRELYAGAVLLFGLGVGLGIAWLFGILRPSVYTKEDVEQVFGLPVLGVVSRVWTRAERVRRRFEVVTFFFGCAVLVGLFSGLVAMEAASSELLAKLRGLDILSRLSSLVWRVI